MAEHPHGRSLLCNEKEYRNVTEVLRLCIFFSPLFETNRPVMQQWEALNAKHIIGEEGSGKRGEEREEEEEEGGDQKKEKKEVELNMKGRDEAKKWQLKD